MAIAVRIAVLVATEAISSRAVGRGRSVHHFGDIGCGIRIGAARAGKQIKFWGRARPARMLDENYSMRSVLAVFFNITAVTNLQRSPATMIEKAGQQ